MNTTRILTGLALIALIALAGCASITKGSSQTVTITCNVDGAELILDGQKIGVTPFTGDIKKNKNQIQVKKDGYESETLFLAKNIDGMFWGNICTGGVVGSITDFSTGAAYTYSPSTYQVTLKADGQSSLNYEQELVLSKFAMIYINQISRDLANGQGEYLSALVDLLDSQEDESTVVELIQSSFESSGGDQVLFGKAMVSLL